MASTQPRKFGAFDIDGTIFRWQLYHELVFDLIDHGVLPATMRRQIAPYLHKWESRVDKTAFTDYELELVTLFQEHLPGLAVEDLRQGALRVMARSGDRVYTYTRDLLERLRTEGYVLIALSGSFSEIVEPFARKYGFDHWVGTTCERQDGHFTGEVVWNYNRKAENLAELIPKYNLTVEGSVAVGDTAGDISMLSSVEQPIAFNPNQELFEYAQAHGWDIVLERKNVVYKLKATRPGYVLADSNDLP